MAQTIKEIIEDATERAGMSVPSKIFGTRDRLARNLRVAANDTVRHMMDLAKRNGWSEFQSVWTFEVRPGQYIYDLPPDYMGVIADTEYQDDWPLTLIGPVGPDAWAAWLNGLTNPGQPFSWRIKGSKMHIAPTPEARSMVSMEYLSRFVAMRALKDLPPDELTAGGNLPRLPLVPAEGMVQYAVTGWSAGTWGSATWGDAAPSGTSETKEEFFQRLRREMADGSLGWTTRSGPFARKQFFDADDDLSAFEDSHALSLGITYRVLEAMRLPYMQFKDRYEQRCEIQLAHDNGGARDFTFGHGECLGGGHQIPLGNGKWVIT